VRPHELTIFSEQNLGVPSVTHIFNPKKSTAWPPCNERIDLRGICCQFFTFGAGGQGRNGKVQLRELTTFPHKNELFSDLLFTVTKALPGLHLMNVLIRVEYAVRSLNLVQGDKGGMEVCSCMSSHIFQHKNESVPSVTHLFGLNKCTARFQHNERLICMIYLRFSVG
jgi:hypothetical protein